MAGTTSGVIGLPPITPTSNPQVNQIYPIVNALFKQMTGRTDVQAVDTNSLIAMGQEIENLGKKDVWLNTMARRIGYTIDGYRIYRNKFSSLARTNEEWGAFIQKIQAEMPEAKRDDMYDIGRLDGQSVDHYIINNPKVRVSMFDKETPFSFFITMSTKLLRDAFLSGPAMQSFINQVFGKVRNKIEVVLEELARVCVANFVINLENWQHYHLVSMYNSEKGTALNSTTALHDADFMAYAVAIINNVSEDMETMSTLFNSYDYDRFTPKEQQHFYMLSAFKFRLETVSLASAINPKYLATEPEIAVPYWQGSGDKEKKKERLGWTESSKIAGTNKDRTPVELNNLVAVIFDHEALGTFREEEDVLTTPVNARAAYYNTFWHEKQLWFNDMGENGVAFFLD